MSVDELTAKLRKLPLEKPIIIDAFLLYSAGPLFLGFETREFPRNPDLKLMQEWYENIAALLDEDNIFVTKQSKKRYTTSNALNIEAERLQERTMTGANTTQEREALNLAAKYHNEISERLETKTTPARINPELTDLTLSILRNLDIRPGKDTEREELAATAFAYTLKGNPCAIASPDPHVTLLFKIYTTMFFFRESLLYSTTTKPEQLELYKLRRAGVHRITAQSPEARSLDPRQITEMMTNTIPELMRTRENDPIIQFYRNQRNNKKST